jgi:hypothetical protein
MLYRGKATCVRLKIVNGRQWRLIFRVADNQKVNA